jgi:hypothetical protein
MSHIVLTDEQVRVLSESHGAVEARDAQGRPVASLRVLDAIDLEAIERHKQRRGKMEPGIPAEQVEAHFRRLEEIRQEDGMDLPKALELLRRMRAGEQV